MMSEHETDAEAREWPIYSLANYSGTGSLVELCSRHLSTNLCSEKGSASFNTNSSSKSIDSDNDKFELRWWQLIEPSHDQTTSDSRDKRPEAAATGADPIRAQVLSLCSHLYKLVSPYIECRASTNGTDDGSEHCARWLEPPPPEEPSVVRDTSERRLGNAGQQQQQHLRRMLNSGQQMDLASVELLASSTRLRRLSWRRRKAARPPARPRPMSSDDELARRRRLAPLGRTLSAAELINFGGGNGGGKTLDGAADEKPSRVAHWIRQAGADKNFRWGRHRCVAGAVCDRMYRWSALPKRRGKYGDSLVHVLIASQTNPHLIVLVLLLEMWPELALDVFASRKFAGLSCTHLSIAYGNERLLQYLISVGARHGWSSAMLEQQVTGSLFAPTSVAGEQEPAPSTRSGRFRLFAGNRARVTSEDTQPAYWCDRVAHWPAPNGQAHLLIVNSGSSWFVAPPPTTQVDQSTDEGDNKPPLVYLGSTPLAWSVGYGSRLMYTHLVAGGARQESRDSLGRTCLHLLAVNNLRGWSRFLAKSGASQLAEDRDRRTPLQLACHLGRAELFDEMLALSAVEFWSYSMICCSGYPLAQLDSILAGDRSAVAAILESSVSTNEQKARLLSSGVVKRLLEEKWQTFARRLFYRELLLTLAHLFLLTLAISLRPVKLAAEHEDMARNGGNHTDATSAQVWHRAWWTELGNNRQQLVRHLAELSTVALAAVQLIGFGNERRRSGNFSRQWIYNPLLPNFISSNGFILCCVPLRLLSILHSAGDGAKLRPEAASQLALAEDVLLIFAAPLLWSSLLFFIAAFRVTGPFVAMIRHMIVRDLRQFSLIYLVFFFAFAQCIFFVNYPQQQEQQPPSLPLDAKESQQKQHQPVAGVERDEQNNFIAHLLANYFQLLMDLFKMTLGVYDLQPYRHSHLARLFFLLFIYLIPILFNMLIAMMNNTYSLIISQSERAWSFQWARTLFALERRLGAKERSAHLRAYSINMVAPAKAADEDAAPEVAAASDGGAVSPSASVAVAAAAAAKKFVPALMIIKRMDCTRAERRRRVVGHWQKSLRIILSELEKQHSSATS